MKDFRKFDGNIPHNALKQIIQPFVVHIVIRQYEKSVSYEVNI
jgi:hypothetical protein